mmetsp:Transcript_34987/g.84668  ORF Transcript_34987/g.84668 Transcript_34987/m.84668 type:complete len:281 (+) Transcript_34987:579-1421(+)
MWGGTGLLFPLPALELSSLSLLLSANVDGDDASRGVTTTNPDTGRSSLAASRFGVLVVVVAVAAVTVVFAGLFKFWTIMAALSASFDDGDFSTTWSQLSKASTDERTAIRLPLSIMPASMVVLRLTLTLVSSSPSSHSAALRNRPLMVPGTLTSILTYPAGVLMLNVLCISRLCVTSYRYSPSCRRPDATHSFMIPSQSDVDGSMETTPEADDDAFVTRCKTLNDVEACWASILSWLSRRAATRRASSDVSRLCVPFQRRSWCSFSCGELRNSSCRSCSF